DHRGEAVIPEEVRPGAAGCKHVASDLIEVQRGDSGSGCARDRLMDLGNASTRGAHVSKLIRRTPDKLPHGPPHREPSTAAASTRNTASGVPTPSMTARRP